jgi:pimeloyl-ACP methyl ester carboxylesterase
MSWYAMVKVGYDSVINAIIRPPRANYTERDLGPKEFEFRGRVFLRSDVVIRNSRGMRIVCSHWEPRADFRPAKALPCVVYLHGNSSCRVGCLENLEVVLGEGATMFALDFCGSGLSDGEWVTLGYYEKDDLAAAIDHLRGSGAVSTIALWGRSMGAATALFHSHRDPSIAGMVLDSPFADLRQLANELVEMGKAQTGYKVPGFVVGAAIRLVRSTVSKKTGMDIFHLSPIKDVDKAFIPAVRARCASGRVPQRPSNPERGITPRDCTKGTTPRDCERNSASLRRTRPVGTRL